MTEHNAIEQLRRATEELREEVRELRTFVRGGEYGQPGVSQRLVNLERETGRVARIAEGIREDAEEREKKEQKDKERRARFQAWALGLMSVIIAGVVLQLVALYVTGAG